MGQGYVLFRAQGEELAGGLALYTMGICFILGMVGRCLGWDDPSAPRGHHVITGPEARLMRRRAAEKAKMDKELAKEFGIALPRHGDKSGTTMNALASMDVALGLDGGGGSLRGKGLKAKHPFDEVGAHAGDPMVWVDDDTGSQLCPSPHRKLRASAADSPQGAWRQPPMGDAPASPFVSARSHLTARLEALRHDQGASGDDASPEKWRGSGGNVDSSSPSIFTATSYAAYVESKPSSTAKKPKSKGTAAGAWGAGGGSGSDGATPARIKYPSAGSS